MFKGSISVLCLLGVISGSAFAASQEKPCKWSRAVWTNDKGPERTLFYFSLPDGSSAEDYTSNTSFDIGTAYGATIERWNGKQLEWTWKGEYGCSNGVSICTVDFPVKGVEGSDAKTAGVSLEAVDERTDGIPNWIVLSPFSQSIYMAGGADVKWWATGKAGPDDSEERITAPNSYRYAFCRTHE